MEEKYAPLRLKNQLCFPLYAASREIIRLYLDSGTLTPLLKALEQKGYVNRFRSKDDERVLLVRLTEKGRELEDRAICVPEQMRACVRLSEEEAQTLYWLLYKLLRPELLPHGEADGNSEN